MSDQKVMSWVHARKGRITGLSVGGDEEWLDIELVEDHGLRYFSESNRGRVDGRGEIIRVQRSLLTEVGTVTGEYAALIAEARGSYRSLDGLVCVSPGLLARLADALEAATAALAAPGQVDEAKLSDALARIERVEALHSPRTIQVLSGDCAIEECGHEDECPTRAFEQCVACDELADSVSTYYAEEGVSVTAYPCPTVRALTEGENE